MRRTRRSVRYVDLPTMCSCATPRRPCPRTTGPSTAVTVHVAKARLNNRSPLRLHADSERPFTRDIPLRRRSIICGGYHLRRSTPRNAPTAVWNMRATTARRAVVCQMMTRTTYCERGAAGPTPTAISHPTQTNRAMTEPACECPFALAPSAAHTPSRIHRGSGHCGRSSQTRGSPNTPASSLCGSST